MNRILAFAIAAGMMAGVSVGTASAQSSYGGSYGSSSSCGEGSTYGGWSGGRLQVVGLTADQRLICFSETDPGSANTLGFISGFLRGDSKLIGIDYRPATQQLYGLGNAGGVYTIDTASARLTFRSQLNVVLSGTSFGVDFNPAVDRMRIISDTGQNLRANVDTGATLVDGILTYTPPTAATGVTGAAYTNNDSDPNTATTLYDIDSTLDQVAIQSPANNGTLSATGKLTVDTHSSVGFDIYSTIRNGTTVDVQGLASLTVGGRSGLYSITLFSGKATLRGTFSTSDQVVDIAIPLNQL